MNALKIFLISLFIFSNGCGGTSTGPTINPIQREFSFVSYATPATSFETNWCIASVQYVIIKPGGNEIEGPYDFVNAQTMINATGETSLPSIPIPVSKDISFSSILITNNCDGKSELKAVSVKNLHGSFTYEHLVQLEVPTNIGAGTGQTSVTVDITAVIERLNAITSSSEIPNAFQALVQ